jgi:hypothetical protein
VRFEDYTIDAAGNRISHRRHYSEDLGREAMEFMARMLRAGGGFGAGGFGAGGWRRPLPHDEFVHVELHWTSESDGAGLASFYARGQIVTTSALASGRDREADRAALKALQQCVLQVMRPAGIEPVFDLMALPERPLLATVPWPAPPSPALREDLIVIADMETCLAAAYFEGLTGREKKETQS